MYHILFPGLIANIWQMFHKQLKVEGSFVRYRFFCTSFHTGHMPDVFFSDLLYHGFWTIKLISNLLDVKLTICHFCQNILYLQASQFYTTDTRRIFIAEERKCFTSVWGKKLSILEHMVYHRSQPLTNGISTFSWELPETSWLPLQSSP